MFQKKNSYVQKYKLVRKRTNMVYLEVFASLLIAGSNCWSLAPANCDFICCLSGLTFPLPHCVPPEEARLQRQVDNKNAMD